MPAWTVRAMPQQLCETIAFRGRAVHSRTAWRVAATVPEDAGRAGTSRECSAAVGRAPACVIAEERRTDLDFALIGHQESWRQAADVLAVLRGAERARLPDEEIREIFPWIPPRAVCNVEVTSATGATARGLYIDCFIPPDHLDCEYVHDNLGRVRAAAACAINRGARIVSLGGFSSILIEGDFDRLSG